MTLALLLLLAGQAADPDALIKDASTRLSVPCGEACAPVRPDERYRIERDGEPGGPRIVDERGARCGVIGDRVCTRKPRTLLSAPIPN